MAAVEHQRPRLEPELTYSDMEAPKGLRNSRGENNCFLNSAVQMLWHVDAFRRRFRKLDDHTCTDVIYGEHSGRCIFCALKVVFTQFQYSDERCVPPDAIRKAMALTFDAEDRFQLGLMEDAAECFERILTRIHYHLNPDAREEECTLAECIPHQQFAMKVVEQRVCNSCSAMSAVVTSVQMVCYVSASALVNAAENKQHLRCTAVSDQYAKQSSNEFSLLLKCALSDMGAGDCPKSKYGHTARMKRSLKSSPDVVTIGLVWDSVQPDQTLVTSVMQTVDCSLHTSCLFDEAPQEIVHRPPLNLVAVLYYYGAHYSVFLYHTKRRMWVCVDDSYVQEVGPDWEQVIKKISRGRCLPLLLVYASHDDVTAANQTAESLTRVSIKHLQSSSTTTEQFRFPANVKAPSNVDGSVGSFTAGVKSKTCPAYRDVAGRKQSRQPSYLAAMVTDCETSQDRAGIGVSASGNCFVRDSRCVTDKNYRNKHCGVPKDRTQLPTAKLHARSFSDMEQWLRNSDESRVILRALDPLLLLLSTRCLIRLSVN